MTDRRIRLLTGGDQDVEEALAALDRPTIQVVLSDRPTWTDELIVLTLVDLLARVFPRVDVAAPEGLALVGCLGPGPTLLHERVRQIREETGLPLLPSEEPALVIGVGHPEVHADIYLDAGEWVSYIGSQPSQMPTNKGAPAVPIGSLCAAARGAAHVAARLAGLQNTRPLPVSAYGSALTYSSSETPIEDVAASGDAAPAMDTVMVGAGSVGGAAIYAFARVPALTGHLVIIDPERLEERNPDRAILATAPAARAQAWKVEVAAQALAHHSDLAIDAVAAGVTEYHTALDQSATLPLVLIAVDSAGSRRSIQDCLPLDVANAACHPHEVTVSGHRTGDGPCVCCLHMRSVLDKDSTKVRLVAAATGMNERMVQELLVQQPPLGRTHLTGIERHCGVPVGALQAFEGRTLDELWRERLMYGQSELRTAKGSVAVAAPWVTAFAGFLLAGEALKAAMPDLVHHRLGPSGSFVKHNESPYGSPLDAQHPHVERWAGSECLCRSPRRLRLIAERYGVDVA